MVSTTPVNFSSLFPDIQQQQVLAQALMQQGSTPINPNRMAGRYVVPISPMEGLSKIADNMAGTYMARNANQQLAKRLFGDSNPSTAPGQQQPVVPWTDPDTGQTVNPVPMNSAASAGTSAPMGGLAGSLALPGMDRQTLMAAMLTDPQALIQAKLNSLAPTDVTKNEMQHSMSRDLANALFQNKLQKESSIEMQPGNTLLMPNGQGGFNPMVAAQFDKGISGGYDANGRPYVAPVPGAAQAAAQMAGAVKGAESANSIYPGVTVNGREGVPVWGTGAPIGGMGSVTPSPQGNLSSPSATNNVSAPNAVPAAPQGNPQNQGVQTVPAMAPNAQGGGLSSPQGGPVPLTLGQTTGDKATLEAAGKNTGNLQNEIDTQAESALGVKRNLSEMRNLLTKFNPSSSQGIRTKLGEIAMGAGADPQMVNGLLNTDVGSTQAFQKNTAALAIEAVKQVSPRATQMEFSKFLENNPNIFMSADGIKRVIDYMDKISDAPLNKQQEFLNYKKSNPPSSWQDFNGYWNQKQRQAVAQGQYNSPPPAQSPTKTAADLNNPQASTLPDIANFQHGQQLSQLPDPRNFPANKAIMGPNGKMKAINGQWVQVQ